MLKETFILNFDSQERTKKKLFKLELKLDLHSLAHQGITNDIKY